jgi:hypothetical protein
MIAWLAARCDQPDYGKLIEPIAKRWRFEALGGVLRLAGRHFR